MKKIFLITLIGISLVACNTEPSLQEYLVEKEKSVEFISASVPTNLFFQNFDSLSSEEMKSLKKIEKINVLALTKKKGESILEEERKELKAVLTQPEYESLINFNSGGREAHLMFVGTEDEIDEIIFFGYDSEMGFLLLRMLGSDVNANDIYQITQTAQQMDMNALTGGFGGLLEELN